MKLDPTDRRILAILQDDAQTPLEAVAERVGLSKTPCWRRIKRMEDAGVIVRRVALLDPDAVGLGGTVFVGVRTSRHDIEWLKRFAEAVRAIPEIVEVFRLSGETDYMMRVVVADIADYDRVYKKLISLVELADVSSSFAMERIKYTTALPVAEL